ncbi:hypothetical protein DFH08DRAFT_799613 [Mycena albidolilacea]|uniref:Uncharacterized protein n=1 Tax=Mycena albidolilacea TaxID=1033008 RepID=A0AAD7AM11_9AGAR|nr:hypothetical protein DFH08DRAFT_799613 [Mycena albidolilacea]
MSTAFADCTSNLSNELKPKPQACLAASLFPTSTRPPAMPAMPLLTNHATINVNARRVCCPEAGCERRGNTHQGGAGGSFLSLPAHPREAVPARTLSQTSASPPFPTSPVFSSTGSAPGGNLGSFGSPNARMQAGQVPLSYHPSPARQLVRIAVFLFSTPPPPFPGYQGMLYQPLPHLPSSTHSDPSEAVSASPQALARIVRPDVGTALHTNVKQRWEHEDVELRGAPGRASARPPSALASPLSSPPPGPPSADIHGPHSYTDSARPPHLSRASTLHTPSHSVARGEGSGPVHMDVAVHHPEAAPAPRARVSSSHALPHPSTSTSTSARSRPVARTSYPPHRLHPYPGAGASSGRKARGSSGGEGLSSEAKRQKLGYLSCAAAPPSTAPSSQPGPPSPTPPAILTQPNRNTRRPLPALPTK